MNRAHEHFAASLTWLSGIGAITAWQEHIDWAIRVGAGVASIAAGIAAVIYYCRKGKIGK